MTRTDRANPGKQKAPKNAFAASAQQSQISRSLSRLLRHQAENEKIPISPAGWVKLDDLLAWRGLQKIAQNITVSDIFGAVEEDGRTGKGRFAVKYIGQEGTSTNLPPASDENSTVSIDEAAVGTLIEATTNLSITNTQIAIPPSSSPLDPTSKNTPETQQSLLHHHLHPTTPSTHYLIRATQGHSMSTIESTSLLTPLTLTTPDLPTTVVHGTFYGSWPLILSTGGLKPMGRNNVHFATGPPIAEILDLSAGAMVKKNQVDEVLSRNKVVSGMRWDAQILIYIDLKRCLEDVADRGLDMSWGISGNGVVLTEGVVVEPPPPPEEGSAGTGEHPVVGAGEPIIASVSAKAQRARENRQGQRQRIVPMEYWDTVVEIKHGVGVLWRRGEGVVKELPERLRNVPVPRGKSRGHREERRGGRGRGRGGTPRPRLNVEKGVEESEEWENRGEREE